MNKRLFPGVVACLLACASTHAAAEPERAIFPIELREDARLAGGKSSFLEGTTNAYGQQFQVSGTQLQQPIAIGLYARDPDRPLRLRVAKGSLDSPISETETDADGRIDLKFRTYDGFKLWVSAAETSDYQLVVWVGDELPVTPSRAVIPETVYAESAGGGGVSSRATPPAATGTGSMPLVIGIALALSIALGAAGFHFISRRRAVSGTP